MQGSGSGNGSPTKLEGSPTKSAKRKQLMKKMSTEYEARGLTEVNVDNAQIAALHTENNRERTMHQSLQKDLDLLRAQLARAEEIRVQQESSLAQANAEIKQQ